VYLDIKLFINQVLPRIQVLTLQETYLTIMSSQSPAKLPVNFPDAPEDATNFTRDTFKAAIVKNPEGWFKYFFEFHQATTEFKSFYEAAVVETQRTQDVNNTLLDKHTSAIQQRDRVQLQLEALQAQHSQQRPAGITKSERLPDPAVFDGTPDKLEGFLLELRGKMSMNADRFPLPQDKLWYAVTRVSGKAKDQVLPYCVGSSVNLTNLAAFEELMQNAFGDPDRRGTAQTTIQHLRQRNQDFSVYLAEFNRHIGYTQWNDEAKKSALLAGISDELRQHLITVDTTELDTNGLIRTLQNIDNRHRAAQLASRANTRPRVTTPQPRAFTTNTTPVTPQLPRAWGSAFGTHSSASPSPFSTAQQVTTTTAVAPAAGGDPMDLSVARPRGPLSLTEKTYRMQNNLCLYCGGEGHKAMACTVKPPARMQLRQVSFGMPPPEGLKDPKNE
jgi:hypothetical protein